MQQANGSILNIPDDQQVAKANPLNRNTVNTFLQVKTEGGLNASASFVAKANPLNRAPHKRKSEFHHALCNMLSNILAPLADGRKGNWPPLGVDPSLNLWSQVVARIRVQLMHWRDKQSKHIALPDTFVDSLNIFVYQVQFLLSTYLLSYVAFVTGTDSEDARIEERVDSLTGAATFRLPDS
nr:protein furry homolog-like [Tanacetum cinerariifolium]